MALVSSSMRIRRLYETAAIAIIRVRMTAKLTAIRDRIVQLFIAISLARTAVTTDGTGPRGRGPAPPDYRARGGATFARCRTITDKISRSDEPAPPQRLLQSPGDLCHGDSTGGDGRIRRF